MLIIRDKLIPVDVEEILLALRMEVPGLFEQIKYVGKNIMTNCISHKGGLEQKPSMGISTEDVERFGKIYPAGTVHCFTCGYSADIPKFVADALGFDTPDEGYKWVIERFAYGSEGERPDIDLGFDKDERDVKYIPNDEIGGYLINRKFSDRATSYLRRRGLRVDILDKFMIGYDQISDCITIPVFDRFFRCLFVKRRPISMKRYLNESDVFKTSTCFGIQHLESLSTNPVWVVEGEIDCLTLWGWGQQAVAIMGSHIAEQQAKELSRVGVSRLILAFDNDKAGRDGIAKAKKLLIPMGFRIYTLDWGVSSKKDVNELTRDEFRALNII